MWTVSTLKINFKFIKNILETPAPYFEDSGNQHVFHTLFNNSYCVVLINIIIIIIIIIDAYSFKFI